MVDLGVDGEKSSKAYLKEVLLDCLEWVRLAHDGTH
jgi:hypothetical protein